MEIQHTLAVDGYIRANSEDTGSNVNGASGGSGGSIIINTHNFTGKLAYVTPYRIQNTYTDVLAVSSVD